MALLGLGGRALRERLIRQYSILPPGSIGQTLFDEIIPVVIVDDLTKGLTLDPFYRAPAISPHVQVAVALEESFAALVAPVGGSLVLVEKVEVRFGTAGAGSIRVGAVGASPVAQARLWRDRRIASSPTCGSFRGTNLGVLGSAMADLRVAATSFTTFQLDVIINPSTAVLESTIAVWNHLVNDQLEVNWFWREIILP